MKDKIIHNFFAISSGASLGECKSAEQNGVYVLHGNRQAFHAETKGWTTEPAFKAVYSAFEEVNSYLRP